MQNKRLDKKQIKKIVFLIAVFALIVFTVLGLFALKAYAACAHQFYNGVCVHCGYACQSCSNEQGQEYRYEQAAMIGNKHTVYRLCTDCRVEYKEGLEDCSFNLQNVCTKCGGTYTDTSSDCIFHYFLFGVCTECGYECLHLIFENGVCTVCKISCPHNSFSYKRIRVDNRDDGHQLEATCIDCGIKTSSIEAHSYSQSECEQCSYRCSHMFWDDGSCRYCSIQCLHPSYNDEKCTVCKMPCPHTTFTETYNAISDNYYHEIVKTCSKCDLSITEKSRHKNIAIEVVQKPYLHYKYNCGLCDRKLFTDFYHYSPPDVDAYYFKPLPVANMWNAKTSDVLFDTVGNATNYDLPFTHAYQRVNIDKFTDEFDYKAGFYMTDGVEKLTLSNGYDFELTASRYLVIRMRKSNIEQIEFAIMGGNGVDDYRAYGYADYFVYGVDQKIPNNQWFNLVLDLGNLKVKNGNYYAYPVGKEIDSLFLCAVSLFKDVNAYVDFEYFALCQDLNQVHSSCHPFNTGTNSLDLNIDTYFVNSSGITLISNSHSFDKDSVCKYCYYLCKHENNKGHTYRENTTCGYYWTCNDCDVEFRRVERKHNFKNGSTTCTLDDCGYVCYHVYNEGVCSNCEWSCVHNFDYSVKCSHCGYYAKIPPFNNDNGFFDLITAIYDAQANTFFSMLGYEIFGINISSLILAIIALAVSIFVFKRVV